MHPKGEPAQRSGSNGVIQSPPIWLVTSAREHDFPGHRQAAGAANRLKKAPNRHDFIPGLCGTFGEQSGRFSATALNE
jgi:hypothetical protein